MEGPTERPTERVVIELRRGEALESEDPLNLSLTGMVTLVIR